VVVVVKAVVGREAMASGYSSSDRMVVMDKKRGRALPIEHS
jgi:hypothetical protein